MTHIELYQNSVKPDEARIVVDGVDLSDAVNREGIRVEYPSDPGKPALVYVSLIADTLDCGIEERKSLADLVADAAEPEGEPQTLADVIAADGEAIASLKRQVDDLTRQVERDTRTRKSLLKRRS